MIKIFKYSTRSLQEVQKMITKQKDKDNQLTKLITFRPKNLPVAANKWRMLLVFKLTKTSGGVMICLFRSSSDSNTAEGGNIFFGDWRTKPPLLL